MRVRGVCFAAGPESLGLARDFARNQLALGTVTFRVGAMALPTWRELTQFFARPQTEVCQVGFLLPDLDLAAHDVQQAIADAILSGTDALWFATVADQRRLIPPLRLAFLVYLGLNPQKGMRFLCQSGQQLIIDEGSLRPPKRG